MKEREQYFWDVQVRVEGSHIAGTPFELTGEVIATNPTAAENETLDERHPNGIQRMRDVGARVVSVVCKGKVDRPIFLKWKR